jgi:hypothetical protein
MRVLCPRCNVIIDLSYLEKKGDQMTSCPNCKMAIAATYKKDGVRRYWEITFETPMPPEKKESRDNGSGCGTALVILILAAIVFSMYRCDWKVPYRPPNDTQPEQFQN